MPEAIERAVPKRRGPPLAELSRVRLMASVAGDGLSWPAGSLGTIVHVYRDGQAYEVEFAHPQVGLATVEADKVDAA